MATVNTFREVVDEVQPSLSVRPITAAIVVASSSDDTPHASKPSSEMTSRLYRTSKIWCRSSEKERGKKRLLLTFSMLPKLLILHFRWV